MKKVFLSFAICLLFIGGVFAFGGCTNGDVGKLADIEAVLPGARGFKEVAYASDAYGLTSNLTALTKAYKAKDGTVVVVIETPDAYIKVIGAIKHQKYIAFNVSQSVDAPFDVLPEKLGAWQYGLNKFVNKIIKFIVPNDINPGSSATDPNIMTSNDALAVNEIFNFYNYISANPVIDANFGGSASILSYVLKNNKEYIAAKATDRATVIAYVVRDKTTGQLIDIKILRYQYRHSSNWTNNTGYGFSLDTISEIINAYNIEVGTEGFYNVSGATSSTNAIKNAIIDAASYEHIL